MLKIGMLSLIALQAFAQTSDIVYLPAPPPPKVRKIFINDQLFYQISTGDQQILIKPKTDPTPTTEEQPTVQNQFERLPVVSVTVGLGFGHFSQRSLNFNQNGETGEWGNLAGHGSQTTYQGQNAVGLEFGPAFRIPTSGPLRKVLTGVLFQSSMPGDACRGGSNYLQQKEYSAFNAGNCTGSFLKTFVGNWAAFSEYDVSIFDNGYSTHTIAIGASYGNHQVGFTDTKNGEITRQSNKEWSGILKYKILTEERGNRKIAVPEWEIGVYVSQNLSYRFTITSTIPIFRKRINPPIRIEK